MKYKPSLNQEEKIDYLNDFLGNKTNDSYRGPKFLYKYRPFDKYAFEMLKNEQVYLCPAKDLDDPTECTTTINFNSLIDLENNNLKIECLKEILRFIEPRISKENFKIFSNAIFSMIPRNGTISPRFLVENCSKLQSLVPENVNISNFINLIVNCQNSLNNPELVEAIDNSVAYAIKSKEVTGICSLAENHDNKKLWELYADNNTGYCIEYDVSNYENNNLILPVVYDDNRNTDIVVQILGAFIGKWVQLFYDQTTKIDTSHFLRLFLTKNTKWNYQNEWRLIHLPGVCIKAPKITAIYLGKNVNKENENQVRQYAKQRNIPVIKNSD